LEWSLFHMGIEVIKWGTFHESDNLLDAKGAYKC
jgi:hypothetical protein